jgi:hypothetical protein
MVAFGGGESTSSSSLPGRCFIMPLRFLPSAAQTTGKARSWYSVNTRGVDDLLFSGFSFPYHGFYCYSTTCQIGTSMATRNLTWGILTSGLASIFFYRHIVLDTNGEPHHILSCSDLVYIDAAHPSLFFPRAATLLGTQDPRALVLRPVSLIIILQPYPLPPTESAGEATCSKIGRHGGSRNHPKSTAHLSSTPSPCDPTSTDVFPPEMSHARQPLRPVKCSHTLCSIQKVANLEYRVGVRGQCLWKVSLFSNSSSYHLI